jgi:hypothetical protein
LADCQDGRGRRQNVTGAGDLSHLVHARAKVAIACSIPFGRRPA